LLVWLVVVVVVVVVVVRVTFSVAISIVRFPSQNEAGKKIAQCSLCTTWYSRKYHKGVWSSTLDQPLEKKNLIRAIPKKKSQLVSRSLYLSLSLP